MYSAPPGLQLSSFFFLAAASHHSEARRARSNGALNAHATAVSQSDTIDYGNDHTEREGWSPRRQVAKGRYQKKRPLVTEIEMSVWRESGKTPGHAARSRLLRNWFIDGASGARLT